ncbi:MAG TPA: hypothetical protein ENJ89_02410, partial [Caldithrix abyssi]|nr:hypothetical protein [Caldithrix abyssi]
MIRHIKNLARHSSVYTFSTFVQRTLGLIMLPIYTDTAYISSRSAYGDLTLVYTFIAFTTIVYLYGMDAALLRYFFLGKFKRQDVYTTGFFAVLVNALVLSGLLFWQSDHVAELLLGEAQAYRYIRLAAGILFLDGLGNLPYLVLRAEEKSVTYSLIRIGRFLLELTLNIVFVVGLHKGVIGILYANLIASFLNLLILLPYQIKYLKGSFRMETLKTLAAFALPMLPNGLAYLTVEASDKYLMRLLLDKDSLGTYSANYKFGSIMLLVVIAFRTAWQPFFLRIAKEEKEPQRIYARVMTYFTLMAAWLVAIGSYSLDYVVKMPLFGSRTLMGSSYWGGVEIIPLILTGYLFYGLYVNLTAGIYIRKKTGWMVLFTGIAALVNVGSNFYLMPHYGIIGAAVATLLSYFVMALSIFLAVRKIYPVRYEYGRIGFILLFLTLVLFVYYFWHPGIWPRLAVLAVFAGIFALFFLRKEERGRLSSIISR